MKVSADGRSSRVLTLTALVLVIVGLAVWVGVADAAPGAGSVSEPRYPDVNLPAPASGSAAVEALGAHLPDVAKAYGLSGAELTRRLSADAHLAVDRGGRLFYADGSPATAPASPSAPAMAPLEDTFRLHSLPGAKRVIYLDFDGHLLSGTVWNDSRNGGADIVCPPFDFEGGSGIFSDGERTRIQQIWQRVAEDYAPFAVDVTTEYPGEAAMTRSNTSDEYYGMRVLVSPISSYIGNYGGVAYVGVFDEVGDYYKPALVLPEKLLQSEKYIGEACSHENGHTLALFHDGTTSGVEYYGGHGTGVTGWAPIMGTGYSQNLTQWSRGEYAAANNTQDDLTVMTGYGVTYRTDDHGDTPSAATPLTGSGQLTTSGLVGRTGDVDLFAVTSGAGTLTVSAAPAALGPNLDIHLELRDATGSVVAFGNPADLLTASLSATVPQGTYHIAVRGTGKGDPLTTGYTDYASLGWYTLAVDVPVATGNQAPTAAMTASPEAGVAPLPVTFDGSASLDADGSVVSYAWDFGDGSTASGVNATHTYATPATYLVTLTVTDSAGATDDTTQLISVQAPMANQAPVAAMTASPEAGLAPLPVTFDGSASSDADGSVVFYAWDFGDGSTASGVNATHTYASPGRYLVTLKVTDSAGATDDTTQWIDAWAPNLAPTAVVTATPASGTAPLAVTFSGSGSSDPDGSIASFEWAFGDGSRATGVAVSHTYSAAGTYTATLTVTDDRGGTATASVTIEASQDQTRVLRVTSVQVTILTVKGGLQAKASVTVVDGAGAPVPGAVVTGQFSGAVIGPASGTTDTTGVATVLSKKFKKGAVVFAVTSVAKSGYTYSPSQTMVW